MSEVRDALIAARALIEKGWTQGAYARDANSLAVSPRNSGAVSFCVYGACSRAALDMAIAEQAKDALCKALRNTQLGAWNDSPFRTKAEVLTLFKLAIAEQP